jgi:hypothetical protein
MAFIHTKKVDVESFIKAQIRIRNRIRSQTSGSGSVSDQKGPDPTGSGFTTLPGKLLVDNLQHVPRGPAGLHVGQINI